MLKNKRIYIEGLPDYIGNKQVQDLVIRYKSGEDHLRNEILIQNVRLLQLIVHRFSNCNTDMEELFQNGFLGLYKALKTYNPEKGTKFNTYASICIENEILLTLRKERKDVNNNISMEFTLNEDNDGKKLVIGDLLVSEEKEGFDLAIEEEEKKDLKIALTYLNKRDQWLLKLRYGFVNETCYSQDELKNLFSVSQSYCSRQITSASQKLKQKMNLLQKNIIQINQKEIVTLENYLESIIKNDSDFQKIIDVFSERDTLIIALGLGYFNDQYFLFEDIANYFQIEIEEVEKIVFQGIKILCEKQKQKKISL